MVVSPLDSSPDCEIDTEPKRRLRGVVAAGVVVLLIVIAASRAVLGGTTPRSWQIVFDGYGEGIRDIGTEAEQAYELTPGRADSTARTHAVLAVDRDDSTNFELRVRMATTEQLRSGSAPNPWEVGWLIWRFTDAEHFYYLALKPNGWELGKRDPSYEGGQRFLATGDAPTFEIGPKWHDVRLRADGDDITVWVDGKFLVEMTDTLDPYPSGRIGMYTEDARAQFASFSLELLDDSAGAQASA